MSASKQKLVYENRITLAAGEQKTLTPTQMGLVLQDQDFAVITQISVGKGLSYILDQNTGNVTIYNNTLLDIENAHLNITAQHSIEYKPVTEAALPASAVIADSALIRGLEERGFNTLDDNNILSAGGQLPWSDVGDSQLPAGTITWDTNGVVGRFTLNKSGKYRISYKSALSSDAAGIMSNSLVRDPANAGAGTTVLQQNGESIPATHLSATVALEEVVTVDEADVAADRTFGTLCVPSAGTAARGFTAQAANVKCANILIEKIA